jgi:hypothetical protein
VHERRPSVLGRPAVVMCRAAGRHSSAETVENRAAALVVIELILRRLDDHADEASTESISRARSKSLAVIPPSEWVEQRNVKVRQRMSMSG